MFEALILGAALAAASPDPADLLRNADAPRQQFLHSTLRVRVTVEEEDGLSKSAELDVYLGDEDQQLVVFRDKFNKGRKFLTVGEKSWLIVPGSRNPIPVTPTQRLLGASSFADIARVRLSQDYTGVLRPGMAPCGDPAKPCHVLDISATVKSAPYAGGTLWIDANGLLRKAVYKLASGKPAKEIHYHYKVTGTESVPTGLTIIDLLVTAQSGKTTLDYLSRTPARHSPTTFDPKSHVTR